MCTFAWGSDIIFPFFDIILIFKLQTSAYTNIQSSEAIYNIKEEFQPCLGKSFDFKRIFFSLFCSGISAQLKSYAWIISNGKIRSFQQMTMKNFYFDEPGYTFYWFRIATILQFHCLCRFTYYGQFYKYEISQWVNLGVCYNKQ